MKRSIFISILSLQTIIAFSQKDTAWLQCPLNNALVVPPAKNEIHYDQDKGIMISSPSDTAVKACSGGQVSNVEKGEDGKFSVVYFLKDYYLWYTNLSAVSVKKNDMVKPGQVIGAISKGTDLELMLFKNENPVDPVKYFMCRSLQSTVK